MSILQRVQQRLSPAGTMSRNEITICEEIGKEFSSIRAEIAAENKKAALSGLRNRDIEQFRITHPTYYQE